MSRMFTVTLWVDSMADNKTELYHDLVKALDNADIEGYEIDDIEDITEQVEQNCNGV